MRVLFSLFFSCYSSPPPLFFPLLMLVKISSENELFASQEENMVQSDAYHFDGEDEF